MAAKKNLSKKHDITKESEVVVNLKRKEASDHELTALSKTVIKDYNESLNEAVATSNRI